MAYKIFVVAADTIIYVLCLPHGHFISLSPYTPLPLAITILLFVFYLKFSLIPGVSFRQQSPTPLLSHTYDPTNSSKFCELSASGIIQFSYLWELSQAFLCQKISYPSRKILIPHFLLPYLHSSLKLVKLKKCFMKHYLYILCPMKLL